MKYYLFKREIGLYNEPLLLSEEKEIKFNDPIKKQVIISFLFKDRMKHFYDSPSRVFTSFEEGDDFISFLVSRGATHVEINVDTFSDTRIISTDGQVLDIVYDWIPTGYEYNLVRNTDKKIIGSLYVPTISDGTKLDLSKSKVPIKISLEHVGDEKDAHIEKYLKKHKSGCVALILFSLVIFICLYLY